MNIGDFRDSVFNRNRVLRRFSHSSGDLFLMLISFNRISAPFDWHCLCDPSDPLASFRSKMMADLQISLKDFLWNSIQSYVDVPEPPLKC
jgi:hypothetical protein